jgi:hypothetical protein
VTLLAHAPTRQTVITQLVGIVPNRTGEWTTKNFVLIKSNTPAVWGEVTSRIGQSPET